MRALSHISETSRDYDLDGKFQVVWDMLYELAELMRVLFFPNDRLNLLSRKSNMNGSEVFILEKNERWIQKIKTIILMESSVSSNL